MSSNIIIKDSSDTTLYTFGAGFKVGGYLLDKRVSESKRAYQHGTLITSDKKLGSRMVIIEGVLHQTEAGVEINSSLAFEAEWDELTEQIDKETLHIYGYKISRYIVCDCLEYADHEWVAKNRAGRIEFGFRASDPFWYSASETDDDNTVDESPESFTQANSGKAAVYPVVTFTAGVGSSISKVKVLNSSDGSRYFEYEPASSLTDGDILEVDNQKGTVKLNGTNDISHLCSVSAFIKLVTGNNSIVVTLTGTAGTNVCNFTFRPRWL